MKLIKRWFSLKDIENAMEQGDAFFTTAMLVRVFYFFLLFASVLFFSPWNYNMGTESGISFILPVAWINWVNFPFALVLIRVSFIVSSLIASIIPQNRIVRIFSFVSLLEFIALYFTILKLDVDWYTLPLVGFLFIFLPNNWSDLNKTSLIDRKKFLLVFWGAQAITMLTYTMSGIGKLFGAALQISLGQSHLFVPEAAALHITDRYMATGKVSPFGDFLVDNYILMWPFFLGIVYVLLFSFYATFRPRLHVLWGIFLIMFHVGNYVSINIGFPVHIFMNCLLFLASPFAPKKFDVASVCTELPLVGFIFKLLFGKIGIKYSS